MTKQGGRRRILKTYRPQSVNRCLNDMTGLVVVHTKIWVGTCPYNCLDDVWDPKGETGVLDYKRMNLWHAFPSYRLDVFQFFPHRCALSAVMQTWLLSTDALPNTRCVSVRTGYTKQGKKQLLLPVLVPWQWRYDTTVHCRRCEFKTEIRVRQGASLNSDGGCCCPNRSSNGR